MSRLTGLDRAKVLFGVSSVLLVFLYGVLVGRYAVFPFSLLKSARNSVEQVIRERYILLGLRPVEHLFPRRYEGSGVTKYDEEGAVPGLTFIAGFFEDSNEMRLIRLDGSVVQRWPVSFSNLFPNPEYIQPSDAIPKTDWNAAIHGALILPDGSVVFNFTYLGTAKLDRCGKVEWTLPYMTHHSIERAEAGGFWIPGRRHVEGEPEYPLLETPYEEDTILRVSDDGRVLSELSVPEILFKNHLEAFLFGRGSRGGDLTHLNDVEELTSDMAGAFPQFAAGDLLLSFRHESLVLVVDPVTLDVKWYQEGPWLGQHDPDFQEDGTITIFSNNADGTPDGSMRGGTTIIRIDPKTRRLSYVYGLEPGQRAYTSERGKHEMIGPAGDHLLFVEADAGRVFEADGKGAIVWEFVNGYDDRDAALVTSARRYSADYFTVTDWSCD